MLLRGVLNFVAGFFDVFSGAVHRIAARAEQRAQGGHNHEQEGEFVGFHFDQN